MIFVSLCKCVTMIPIQTYLRPEENKKGLVRGSGDGVSLISILQLVELTLAVNHGRSWDIWIQILHSSEK